MSSPIRDSAFGGFVMGIFFILAVTLGVIGAFFFFKWWFSTIDLKDVLMGVLLG